MLFRSHVVASGNLTDDDAGSLFNSNMMMAGATFSYTFEDAGDYPYFCMVHPWMVGTVIVEDESGHDDHGDDHAVEEMDHSDMDMGGMEMQTLTAADITIDVADGATTSEKVAIDVTINGEHVNYDIVATHNGETILDESGNHSHDGTGSQIGRASCRERV